MPYVTHNFMANLWEQAGPSLAEQATDAAHEAIDYASGHDAVVATGDAVGHSVDLYNEADSVSNAIGAATDPVDHAVSATNMNVAEAAAAGAWQGTDIDFSSVHIVSLDEGANAWLNDPAEGALAQFSAWIDGLGYDELTPVTEFLNSYIADGVSVPDYGLAGLDEVVTPGFDSEHALAVFQQETLDSIASVAEGAALLGRIGGDILQAAAEGQVGVDAVVDAVKDHTSIDEWLASVRALPEAYQDLGKEVQEKFALMIAEVQSGVRESMNAVTGFLVYRKARQVVKRAAVYGASLGAQKLQEKYHGMREDECRAELDRRTEEDEGPAFWKEWHRLYAEDRHLTTEFRCPKKWAQCKRVRVNLKFSIMQARAVKGVEGLCLRASGSAGGGEQEDEDEEDRCRGLHRKNNRTMHSKENCEAVDGCVFDGSSWGKENATAVVIKRLRRDARMRVFRTCQDKATQSHLMQTACECKQTLRSGFRDIFLSGRGKNTTEAEKRELETCESGVEQWQDRKKKEAQAKLREEGGPVAEAVPEF